MVGRASPSADRGGVGSVYRRTGGREKGSRHRDPQSLEACEGARGDSRRDSSEQHHHDRPDRGRKNRDCASVGAAVGGSLRKGRGVQVYRSRVCGARCGIHGSRPCGCGRQHGAQRARGRRVSHGGEARRRTVARPASATPGEEADAIPKCLSITGNAACHDRTGLVRRFSVGRSAAGRWGYTRARRPRGTAPTHARETPQAPEGREARRPGGRGRGLRASDSNVRDHAVSTRHGGPRHQPGRNAARHAAQANQETSAQDQ